MSTINEITVEKAEKIAERFEKDYNRLNEIITEITNSVKKHDFFTFGKFHFLICLYKNKQNI